MPDPLIGGSKLVTDMLLFRRVADGETIHTFGWAGVWPPPGELTVVVEAASGDFKVIEWSAQPSTFHDWMNEAHEKGTIRVSHWVRNRASAIEEPARPDESWFRGAEYLPKS